MMDKALLAPINTSIYTTTGAATIGYGSGQVFPAHVLMVSAASAVTLTLPTPTLGYPSTGNGLGAGRGSEIWVTNLAAQSVIVTAGTLLGATTSIAQNASALFVSDPDNARWVRVSG